MSKDDQQVPETIKRSLRTVLLGQLRNTSALDVYELELFDWYVRETEHLIHPIRVQSFQVIAPYTLRVQFNDGSERSIDFDPILAGQLYGPLRDLSVFNRVQLDVEVHTLVWPNGADFDPATLHDWPEQVQELTERARQWELTRA